MKKYFLIFLAGLMILSLSCKKANTDEKENAPTSTEKNESAISTEEKTDDDNDEDIVESVLPPMVKVKGIIYKNTGYENAMVKCGTADGEIETSVESTKEPEIDDESNFGKGYEYQYWEDGYINVEIDNKWMLFKDINLKDNEEEIPKWVGHFTGKVISVEEDSIMVQATEIDDEFYFKKILTKPIALPVDNLRHEKDEFLSTEGLEGKSVEVYFGGEIEHTEPESSLPIYIGDVYRIEIK
ncbi:hypothetical protein [Ezakiella peruensis]|uniref:hypothetical protein n=1 Tax=Ezakiella peruensis TaxID=1464038 RepID=UPI000C1B4A9D|nr:hypothetical protein [Ezakiella peruensis]